MSIFTPTKQIRIAVIAANEVEDIEFIVPIDIWRRAKFIVDVVVSEVKNNFALHYSSLKVCGQFNMKLTNLNQYDAIYLPGGPAYKSYLNTATQKYGGESKLHHSLNKFCTDEGKWLISMCAAPIALLYILDKNKPENFLYTSHKDPKLIGDLTEGWIDQSVVVDQKIITAQGAGSAFDLAFAVVESLGSLELAQKVAENINYDYPGYKTISKNLDKKIKDSKIRHEERLKNPIEDDEL